MKALLACTLALLCGSGLALYSSSDDVIELNPDNFNKLVINGDELWMVEFYAPWCGHCKSLAPEWKKAATALKGIVKVGAVDMDQHQSLGGPYNVRGFPTLKMFGLDKNKPQDYNGARTAQSIVDTALSTLKSMASARMSGRGGSSGGGGKKQQKQSDPDAVVELTDSNFEKLVLKSDDMWLVEFFAPWCGHCKNLAPHWEQAATDLKGKVKLGALDATVHTVMSSRYGVSGFPTIKMFASGKKDDGASEYDGGRTANDIVAWALDKLAENVPTPEIVQLTSDQVLKDACEEHQLCVVGVLPDILDCQSECRNKYLGLMKRMGDKYKKKMWGWVWAEAGSQLNLEEALGMGGFGYPAMAAVNARKMKYASLMGPFEDAGINEFLRALSVGRGSTAPLKSAKLPKIANIEPWDGKDGEMPVEDDIDLSDVDLDDFEELSKDEL